MKASQVDFDEGFFISLRSDTMQARERREIAMSRIQHDIRYFQRKLSVALGLPAEYLGTPEP
jgi:hypothetical protein